MHHEGSSARRLALACLFVTPALAGCEKPPMVASVPAAPTTTAPTSERADAPRTPRAGRSAKLELVGAQGADYPGVLVVHGTALGTPTMFAITTATGRYLAGGLSLTDRFLVETAKVATWSSVPDNVAKPAMAIDGWGPLPERAARMMSASSAFEVLKIGGTVTPHLLVDANEAVILDFRAMEMARVAASDVDARLGPGDELAPKGGRVCRVAGQGANRNYLVPATIAGVGVELLLDTDEYSPVWLHENTTAGKALLAMGKPVPLQGEGCIRFGGGAELAQVVTHVGAFSFKTDTITVRGYGGEETCDGDGYLGLNALRRCAIAFTKDRVVGRCTS